MKEPGHRSPAPPRSKPSHVWRRFVPAFFHPHWDSWERSQGHSHGAAFLCQCRLWAVAEKAMLSFRGSSAAPVDHDSQGNSSWTVYGSWGLTHKYLEVLSTLVCNCHLQRTKYAGSFYLHGSNLKVHSKSPSLKNFRSSNSFSSCMCVHVLNLFLPSIPMMSTYWCHSTDAG